MDWQHLLMNGENLGEYAALLAAEGLLGHQHANSGWGTFDDDNMVGATAFMETLELALELRRAGYGATTAAARLRPLPVHRGPGRGGQALGAPVALHRRRRRAIDDGGAARGADAQGRGARLRARVRGARRAVMRSSGSTSGRPRSRGWRSTEDGAVLARRRGGLPASTRRGRAGPSRTRSCGGRPPSACSTRSAAPASRRRSG